VACPSREELIALVDGELEATSRASIEAHLAECASCKQAGKLLVEGSSPSQTLTSHARARLDRPARDTRRPEIGIQPGTYVGRYIVLDLIGTGGMGSVYRAYDPKLNRNVAVKVIRVRPSAEDDEAPRPRLLREAQALAQVVHPHVVSIFDVGEFHEQQVFFAMELIDGSTLRDVMRRGEHDPRRLLRLLDQAGRGLAAAHDAGLVHRDFKPENVLIDREQRAKVVDFGLARSVDAHKADDLVSVPPGASPSVLDRRITETGAFVGTPAYMSPEQYLGAATDARSDQFSFSCVAYEALFGRHPFMTEGGKISMVALCAGKIEAPGRRVDPGYLRVLTRALSRDPANRYPSLTNLLDDLANVPRRRRRRVVAMGAAMCTAAALIGVPVFQQRVARRCETAATQALGGIWDGPRREQVEGVLAGDGKGFGRDLWQRVAAVLDGYAEQWKHADVELCRSTEWWRGEDSAMKKRASSCLDERRRELRAVTDVLAGGDQDARLHAPDVLIQLDSVSSCTNPAALALTSLPTYDRAASIPVGRIRDLLAQSRALNDADKVEPAEQAARQALDLARAQHDQALSAEALYRLGVAQSNADKNDEAEASIVQALADAEASGHERLLPLIWVQLLSVVGHEQAHPDEVERLIPFVKATVERLDPQGPAHSELLYVLGIIENLRGRDARAIEHLDAALDIGRGFFAEHDARRIEIYGQLSNVERSVHQLDKAIAHARAALAEGEALFGKDHPHLVLTLSQLARALIEQGDTEGAQAVGQRALRIVEQESSTEIPDLAHALFDLAMAYLEDGQPAVALPLLRRSYAGYGTDDPRRASIALLGIGRAEAALGHLETARTTFEEVVAVNRRLAGPGHPHTIIAGVRLGRVLRTLHREQDSLQLCTQLLEAGERQLGPHGIYIALALSCVGEGDEELGRLPEALKALERAKKLLDDEKTEPRPDLRATVGFALARVLWRTGGDRARARHLATDAADAYQHAGRGYAQDVAAVQAWLTKTTAQPH